jgi:hypothetical protein
MILDTAKTELAIANERFQGLVHLEEPLLAKLQSQGIGL